MEIPGTAPLKEARLRLSTEGGAHVFILEEPASGRLYRLSSAVAAMVLRSRRALFGEGAPAPGAREEIAALAAHLTTLRGGAVAGAKPFNPLFINIPLFDPRPLQKHLTGLAALVFSRGALVVCALALLAALWLAAASDFVFFALIGDIFSIEALLTFALIAPFLKAAHELGHLLAATKFGAPVRKAGVILLGLFPLPFVDCSEAEFRVQRFGRIMISLAGLLADLTVGLACFIAWHFVDDPGLRQVLSNVVVFSTATTLLFNLNPLMRLDGYFALSDAIHRRNLHLESAMALSRVKARLSSLEVGEAMRLVWAEPWRIALAAMSAIYKIWILLFIAWTLAPQYLGVGAALVAWGAAVMFLTPLMKTQSVQDGAGASTRRRLAKLVLAGALGLLAFVPMRSHVVLPVAVDLNGAYLVRAAAEGDVVFIRPSGAVDAGAPLVDLSNIETDVRIALNDADLAMMRYLADSVRAENPLAAQSAQERIAAAAAIAEDLAEEQTALRTASVAAGWFRTADDLRPGAHVAIGDPLGHLLPDTDETALTGELPEIYADRFQTALEAAALRVEGRGFIEDGALAVRIAEARGVEGRSSIIHLAATAQGAPHDLAGRRLHLRLTFSPEPLWRHGVFLFNRLRLNFEEAQGRARADANGATEN